MIIWRMAGVTAEHSRLLRPNYDYVVYGILFDISPKFLVYEADELSFQFFVESVAIDVVDARLSDRWFYSPRLPTTDLDSSSPPIVSFDVMVRSRRFYQELVAGEPAAVAAWEEAKRQIDSEVTRIS